MLLRALLPAIAGILAVIAAAQPTAAVPPPPEQMGADCTAPTYASDQLVCSDPALLQIDRRMIAELGLAGLKATEPASPFIEPQSAWVRRRSSCAFKAEHRQCLEQAYQERIRVLQGLAGVKASPSPTFRCTKGPASLMHELRSSGDSAIVLAPNGQVSGVAVLAQKGRAQWKPFLAFALERSKAALIPLEGRRVVCTLVKS